MGKSSSKLMSNNDPDTQISKILDDEHLLAPFLTNIFYQEVEVSDSMQTLFRGNCLASKIMSHCFRTFGSRYLKDLLEPHIRQLLELERESKHDSALSSPARLWRTSSNDTSSTQTAQLISKRLSQDETTSKTAITRTKSTISYEIDSARLDEDDDIDMNQKNLLRLTNEILNSVLRSAPDFPPQLNLMCICLRDVLDKKYPNTDASLKAVGTVIFLRFINPAIVSPYEAGVTDKQLKPKTMRGLMLVSKILQNIANNVEFSKEEHMLPFNDFVRGQFEPIRKWANEISTDRQRQHK